MKNKVLIVGDEYFRSAVTRALIGVAKLNRSLTRYLYSRNVCDNLISCNFNLLDNTLSQRYEIKLIIAHLDLPAFALIRDIRIGTFGESIAKVPIIIISAHSFTHASSPLILYHIYQNGSYLEIPFKLNRLRIALDSIKSLRDEQLSRIRSNKTIVCDVIDSISHSLTETNYRTSLQQIKVLVEANLQEEFSTIRILNGLLGGSEKIDGKSCPHIRRILNELRMEVMTDDR